LKEKETKSSSEFDAGESFSLKFSYDELAFGKVIFVEGLKVEHFASCCYTFLEGAVFFTLNFVVALCLRLVKNKALGKFFRSEGWLHA
jgi:hypothetical protein